jgi:hypothetical protein
LLLQQQRARRPDVLRGGNMREAATAKVILAAGIVDGHTVSDTWVLRTTALAMMARARRPVVPERRQRHTHKAEQADARKEKKKRAE